MNVFSQTQRYKALFWLSLFHLLVITSSNYLVQLPVSIFGFHTTRGAFSFPFIFLATDLTVRIFWRTAGPSYHLCGDDPGVADLLRHLVAILYGFPGRDSAHSPTSTCLSPVSPPPVSWPTRWDRSSTCTFLTACVRVAAGGWHRQRPHCSVTSATRWPFFFIAFWRSPDAFMAEHWMEIALVDYCFKVLISIVFFLPMYGVLLNMLLKRLADKSEINALQAS